MRRFYFALPRMLTDPKAARSEMNWGEANLAGAGVFLVSYAALDQLLAGPSIVLLVPLAILAWLLWIVALYVNSLVIKLLRACGLMRAVSDARAQSVLIGATTTALACWLLEADSWVRWLGAAWLVVTSLNLLAALALATIPREA